MSAEEAKVSVDLFRRSAERAVEKALQAMDEAIAHCRQAVVTDPNLTQSFYLRGLMHLAKGDFYKAIPDLGAAVAAVPGIPEALAARAIAFASQGDRKQAEAHRKAAELIFSIRDELPEEPE